MDHDYHASRAEALADILRGFSVWLNATDRRIQCDRLRAFCMSDPEGYREQLNAACDMLEDELSFDHLDAIKLALTGGASQYDFSPSVFVGDECEYEFQLYGIGLFATGLRNEPFRSDLLSEAQAAEIRRILYEQWFDPEVAEVFIFEGLPQLNAHICTDTVIAWEFTRDFSERAAPLTPIIDKPQYPDYSPDQSLSENIARWNAEGRMLIFGVKFPRHSLDRPVLRRPYLHGGRYPFHLKPDSKFFPDLIAASPYGRQLTKVLSEFGSFRWHFTDPMPFFDALSELDYSISPYVFLTCASRLLMDTGLSVNEIIASPASFVDHYAGYAEMRVAFAAKDRPDAILSAATATIRYDGPNGDTEWFSSYAKDIHHLLTSNGIPTIPVEKFGYQYEAEPESVDRLFMTSTGRVVSFRQVEVNTFGHDGDLPPMPPTHFN